ncbi:MFS transporter [bacterium]|nr:MFS transporter [bacterium]
MDVQETLKVVPLQIKPEGRLLKTGSYYLVFIIIGMCVAILGPTLPDLAKNTHTRISHLSFLFTARSLGYLVGAYAGGRIYDEIKGHPLISLTLILTALLLALIPITELLGVLIILILLLGVAESVIDVGGNTLLVWIHREKVGTYMNGLHLFFGVGGFIAPVILAQVILVTNDISWAYWILALSILPVAILMFFIPSPQIRQTRIGEEKVENNKLLIAGVICFFFLWVGAEGGFGGWIYTYALKSGLTDKAGAAYMTSAFWGAFTIGRLLSVVIAIKLKPVHLLFGSLVGTLASLTIILLEPSSLNALLFGTIGVGIFMASVFPTTLSFSERRMVLSGRVTSWFFIAAGVGGMTLPWFMGQFIESSLFLVLIIPIATITAAILVLLWICCWLRPKIIG